LPDEFDPMCSRLSRAPGVRPPITVTQGPPSKAFRPYDSAWAPCSTRMYGDRSADACLQASRYRLDLTEEHPRDDRHQGHPEWKCLHRLEINSTVGARPRGGGHLAVGKVSLVSGRPIVVGVDGNPLSRAALLWAARAAEAAHRPLLIAHAREFTERADAVEGDESAGVVLLGEAEACVRAAGLTCEIHRLLVDEEPQPLLDRLSLNAAMVVVGSATEGRLGAMLLGSVSSHLAAHANSTVVTVPAAWAEKEAVPQPLVVVAVSASPGGREALAFAVSYARANHAQVQAIYCWDRRFAADEADPLAERDIRRGELGQLIEQAVVGTDVVIVPRVAPGPVEDVIRRAAEEAALVVVGSRFPVGGHGSRLGSTASRLMRRMPCPVALVSAADSSAHPKTAPVG
jgi:nucleotide-binding universal stress UspA family protein